MDAESLAFSFAALERGDSGIPAVWGEVVRGQLLIEARAPIAPGPLALQVSYVGPVLAEGAGLVRASLPGGAHRVDARLAGGGARRIVPCRDDSTAIAWSWIVETQGRLESPRGLVRGPVRLGRGSRFVLMRSRGARSPGSLGFSLDFPPARPGAEKR